MPDTAFGTLQECAERQTDTIRMHLPDDWMQGGAGFGGLLGALVLKSMRVHVPAARKVRSLLVAFVGPMDKGALTVQGGSMAVWTI
jgi:acyl-CoA thioesterase